MVGTGGIANVPESFPLGRNRPLLFGIGAALIGLRRQPHSSG
jgi:hypothetical protein